MDPELRKACDIRRIPDCLEDWYNIVGPIDLEINLQLKPALEKLARRTLGHRTPVKLREAEKLALGGPSNATNVANLGIEHLSAWFLHQSRKLGPPQRVREREPHKSHQTRGDSPGKP